MGNGAPVKPGVIEQRLDLNKTAELELAKPTEFLFNCIHVNQYGGSRVGFWPTLRPFTMFSVIVYRET